MASTSDNKSMSTSKSDFIEINGFTSARINFFKILEVEVGSKIGQTSIKNDDKTGWHIRSDFSLIFVGLGGQIGLLGASLGPLGGLLGGSWGFLGHLGGVLGRLGASKGVLEPRR